MKINLRCLPGFLLGLMLAAPLVAQSTEPGSQPGFTIQLKVPSNAVSIDPPISVPANVNKTSTATIVRSFDTDFPIAYRAAANFACDIWETHIKSDQPIKIYFKNHSANNGILAETNVFTGIEDDFNLMGDINCATPAPARLNPGEDYLFNTCYVDHYPYNAPPETYFWSLDILYTDIEGNVNSFPLSDSAFDGTYDSWFSGNVPANLPQWGNGNVWLRNFDGSLRAVVSVFAISADDEYFSDELQVGLVYPLSQPLIGISSESCQTATLEFYSQGAAAYIIHYSTTAGAPYEYSVNVPSGSYSFTIDGLSLLSDYYFTVEAFNAEGQSTMGSQVKKDRC